MKCVLVVLAGVLLLCTFHTRATSVQMQKRSFPKMNMRYKNLQGIPSAVWFDDFIDAIKKVFTRVKPITGTVHGSVSITGASAITVTVTSSPGSSTDSVIVSGTGSDDGTGNVAITGAITIELTGTGSGIVTGTVTGNDGTTGIGSVTGNVSRTGKFARSVKIILKLTASSTNGPVIGTVGRIDGDPFIGSFTISINVTGAGTGTIAGTVKKTPVVPSPKSTPYANGNKGSNPGTPDKKTVYSSPTTTTTTTEAPETTTTSTASPKENHQKSTKKTDSSYGNVASLVALFIGTIALLSVF